MKFKNKFSGEIITFNSDISGKIWERVKEPLPKKKPKKKKEDKNE